MRKFQPSPNFLLRRRGVARFAGLRFRWRWLLPVLVMSCAPPLWIESRCHAFAAWGWSLARASKNATAHSPHENQRSDATRKKTFRRIASNELREAF